MPRTAEFELGFQTELAKFSDFFEKCIPAGDGPIEPPREFSIPINVRSVHGEARMLFTHLFTRMNAGDTFTLAFSFSNSTLAFTSPLPLRLTPLEGRLLITAPVLFAAASGRMAVDLDFARAHAALELAHEHTPDLFQQYLAEAITAFIRPLARRQFFRRLHSSGTAQSFEGSS